jgi:hypothetical protein
MGVWHLSTPCRAVGRRPLVQWWGFMMKKGWLLRACLLLFLGGLVACFGRSGTVLAVSQARYVDAAAAPGGDFHLAEGSSGVGQGAALMPAIVVDFERRVRDTPPDVGAFEGSGSLDYMNFLPCVVSSRLDSYSLGLQIKQSARTPSKAAKNGINGNEHWTLQMLADKLIKLEVVETVSYETVRTTLKKMNLSLDGFCVDWKRRQRLSPCD